MVETRLIASLVLNFYQFHFEDRLQEQGCVLLLMFLDKYYQEKENISFFVTIF